MFSSPSPRRRRHVTALATATVVILLLISFALPRGSSAKMESRPAAGAVEADAIGIIDHDWFDTTRQRAVPAKLFWPPQASRQRVPLVLFSHGIGSSSDGYTHLGRYWAKHGVASLHVRHIGSDRNLWRGNALLLLARFQQAAGDAEAIARARDVSFALDRLLASSVGAGIDRSHIIAAGHSYGANTTLLLAGARVLRDGELLRLADTRISGAILISAPPFYGEADFAPILSGIAIPTLHITTQHDIIRIPGFGSGVEDRRRVFDAIGGEKILAVYREGSHNVFTDKRYFDSPDVADHAKRATQTLTLAFLEQLAGRGGTDSINRWVQAHPRLLADYQVRD